MSMARKVLGLVIPDKLRRSLNTPFTVPLVMVIAAKGQSLLRSAHESCRGLSVEPKPKPSRPYRILFVSQSKGIGGAERSLLGLLANFDSEVISPLVLLPGSGSLERAVQKLGVPCIKVPFAPWLSDRHSFPKFAYRLAKTLLFCPRLVNEVRKLRPDLVYTNSLVIPEGAVAGILLHKPHIWHIREIAAGYEGSIPTPLILHLIPYLSARIIAVTEAARLQFPPRARKSVLTVYNGIDLSTYGPNKHENRPEQVSKGQAKLTVVGRLVADKEQLGAIKAIEFLRSEFPNISLSIVGDGDPSYKALLERYIATHGLDEHVELLGYLEDPMPVFYQSDLTIVPSRFEAFGRVVIESLAAGTPVVATETGGIPEILRYGGGVLVPIGSPGPLAMTIGDLLRRPERLQSLRSEARSVAERFRIQHTAALIQNEITDVLERES